MVDSSGLGDWGKEGKSQDFINFAPSNAKDMISERTGSPIDVKQRHVILDALRGIALFGICLANFPEFSLYSFLSDADASALP